MIKARQTIERLLDNPIASKEMKLFIRGKGNLLWLFIFLTVLFCIALWYMQLEMRSYSVSRDSGIGYLWTLVVILSLALAVIVPSRAAGSITLEKEKRTFDLLVTTLLSPREIILGKLFYSMELFAFLLFLTLPFFPLGFFLGGLSPWTLLRFTFWLVLVALLFSSAAILLSSYATKTVTVTGGIYGLGFLSLWVTSGLVLPLVTQQFNRGAANPYAVYEIPLLLATLAWSIFFSLEKAADNILLEKLRKPRYFKKLFAVGYALGMCLLLFTANPGSGQGFAGFFTLIGIVHFLMLILFPPHQGITRWEALYVLVVAPLGLAATTWWSGQGLLPQSIASSGVIYLDLCFFAQLCYFLSLTGRDVEKIRRALGMVLLFLLLLTMVFSIIAAGSQSVGERGLTFVPFMAVLAVWENSQNSTAALGHGVLMLMLMGALGILTATNRRAQPAGGEASSR